MNKTNPITIAITTSKRTSKRLKTQLLSSEMEPLQMEEMQQPTQVVRIYSFLCLATPSN
jgi:hypothetical protein